ncbi:hypothetical protein AMTRI_Chr02g265330 [Amborella trichopoda]
MLLLSRAQGNQKFQTRSQLLGFFFAHSCCLLFAPENRKQVPCNLVGTGVAVAENAKKAIFCWVWEKGGGERKRIGEREGDRKSNKCS